MLVLVLSWLSLGGCQTPSEKPDPANALGCDPAIERCISISEREFEHYLETLEDKAILRNQLKACEERRR